MKILSYLITSTTALFLFSKVANASTYYVSSQSGDDTNSGLSASTAWKSLNKVNTAPINPGDSILFKRENIWRGQLIPTSGNMTANVYYGAYSSGNNPVILGSLNFNNTNDWVHQGGNIWESNATFQTDIGNIIFDNAASVGFKKWNLIDLQTQDDFLYSLTTGKVIVYSLANPASIHSEVELAKREHIINQENTSFVTYENLSLKYGAAHGIGGGNTSYITITSCEISYIGGGDLNMNGNIRFGNGVEFWGNSSNNTVEKCKIWEIYDTGLSNQNHTTPALQQNIKYRNNIIWNCGLSSFEYWNRPSTSITSEIYFENNTCLNAGSGWGNQRPDYHGIHFLIDNNTAQTDTIYIRNNIFYNAQRSIYAIEDNINGFIKLNYNLIHQTNTTDTLFVSFPSFLTYNFGDFTTYSNLTGKDINSLTGDPLFLNPIGLNFELTSMSNCINNGTIVDLQEDFEGNPRPLLGAYDIGAYEYDGLQNIQTKHQHVSLTIYPNPARTKFHVNYSNHHNTKSNLYLFNPQGQIIHMINNYLPMNEINVSHFSNGCYSIMIDFGNGTVSTGKIQVQK